ncbi:adhesive plaque matrix protein [Plakobranchus ocellatus]|uniref:Adhesive plaque matrix protein n=1 Tax=Plakobranchus ocellatus TaxID=259542 RepID=A0AAV3ZXF6_9GAST|nr:adhesive plaque matrix protein [Plakobranchus ocellatus]
MLFPAYSLSTPIAYPLPANRLTPTRIPPSFLPTHLLPTHLLPSCLPTHPPAYPSTTFLPTYPLTAYLPTTFLSTYLPTYLPTHLLLSCLPTHLPAYPSTTLLPAYPPTYLPTPAACQNCDFDMICDRCDKVVAETMISPHYRQQPSTDPAMNRLSIETSGKSLVLAGSSLCLLSRDSLAPDFVFCRADNSRFQSMVVSGQATKPSLPLATS